MEKRFVYADNAATTKVTPEVFDAMKEFYEDNYGNPSSIYSKGVEAAVEIEKARRLLANCLGARPNEIYITSGGSEADNWAIKGTAKELAKKGKKHIITSAFEHHAVLHSCEALAKEGFEITYLPVYENGIVKPEDVENAIREDTALVTIMMANNEIGTIQPIKEIAEICKKHGVLCHTDAVQAVGHIPVNVADLKVDMLSVSGHKFHSPKGVGLLYIRSGVRIANLIDGGAQERSKRAGTENAAGIVGMATALKNAVDNMEETNKKLTAMRDKLIEGVLKIERSRLNGDAKTRLPGNANFCFEGIEGESLLLSLDNVGVCASSGSACTSGSLDPSHVLLSIGLPKEVAHGSLRVSFSDLNKEDDADYLLEVIPPIVKRLRDMSPLWDRIMKENK